MELSKVLEAVKKNEDKMEFGQVLQAIKANFNDKYADYRKKWGGGIMGSRSQANTESKERVLANEAAQRMNETEEQRHVDMSWIMGLDIICFLQASISCGELLLLRVCLLEQKVVKDQETTGTVDQKSTAYLNQKAKVDIRTLAASR